MRSAHDHVDAHVLEEVERVLTSTSFASINDLAQRLVSDVADVAPLVARPTPLRSATRVPEPVLATGEPVAPLPRRR